VIALDPRGHGESDKPEQEPNVAEKLDVQQPFSQHVKLALNIAKQEIAAGRSYRH
jgi:hypothetical protein